MPARRSARFAGDFDSLVRRSCGLVVVAFPGLRALFAVQLPDGTHECCASKPSLLHLWPAHFKKLVVMANHSDQFQATCRLIVALLMAAMAGSATAYNPAQLSWSSAFDRAPPGSLFDPAAPNLLVGSLSRFFDLDFFWPTDKESGRFFRVAKPIRPAAGLSSAVTA
jgi:hypothetical protein